MPLSSMKLDKMLHLDCDACFIPVDISSQEARQAICTAIGDTVTTCAYANSTLSYNGRRNEMRDYILQLCNVETCGGLFSTADAAVNGALIAKKIKSAVVIGHQYTVRRSSS